MTLSYLLQLLDEFGRIVDLPLEAARRWNRLADKVLWLSREEASNKANLSSLLHDPAKERRDARYDKMCVNLYIFQYFAFTN